MVLSSSLRTAWPDRTAALTILVGLALLTVLAWTVTFWQARERDFLMMVGVPMNLEMSGRFNGGSVVLFLLIWLTMMVAMMFPSVWPTVLLYAAATRKREAGSAPLFVAGYLLAWQGFGAVAYGGYAGAGTFIAGLKSHFPLLTGALVIVAGLYQFTSVKRVCLKHCQGPLEYLATHWHDGRAGALRMGLSHGSYCIGCCAGLMLALLALGVMDLRWMATVSTVIAVEKLGPRHPSLPQVVGIGLLLLGLAIASLPYLKLA